jgi:hypothetical protein
MINEAQLQSFWRFKSINLKNLKTTCGQTLVVIEPGLYNAHQGPDFKNARIKVGNVEWVGNIELHVCTSDWVKHAHQIDINYKNIILHVSDKFEYKKNKLFYTESQKYYRTNHYFLSANSPFI